MILEAFNPLFEKEFAKHTSEQAVLKVPVQNCVASDFEAFLQFCYGESLPTSNESTKGFLKAVDQFRCRPIIDEILADLKSSLSSSNCFDLWDFATGLQMTELATAAKEYIVGHFQDVVNEKEFIQIDFERLRDLLMSADLNIKEETAFVAVIAWTKHETAERERDSSLDCSSVLILGSYQQT